MAAFETVALGLLTALSLSVAYVWHSFRLQEVRRKYEERLSRERVEFERFLDAVEREHVDDEEADLSSKFRYDPPRRRGRE